MPHPPYSPDISPCDCHYFLRLQNFLVGRDTRTQTLLDNHIKQLINTRPKQFWKDGIRNLTSILGVFIEINDIYNNDVCIIINFPAKEDKDHCSDGQR
ncbi:unnamed protein product [Heligmosomoides polygyrus]|uniref:Histone-lysine N-methyltransferase SETMAR n=1 Tax=Heligmosomoides polygyrus TaxID=6339 RepID=A0A183FQ18_HELPZ|nr:unnamed protein product [Heligmosomoides polygyrus]